MFKKTNGEIVKTVPTSSILSYIQKTPNLYQYFNFPLNNMNVI